MFDPDGCRVRFRAADGLVDDVPIDRVRAADLVAARPVRAFRSFRGQRFYSGWYWSATEGHHVVYESRLELARLLLADQDPRVARIVGQPMLLQGRDGVRVRRHVPDFLLTLTDGSTRLVDVKPQDRLTDPKVAAQFAWTRELCAVLGWDFEVWSRGDPDLIANIRYLAGYRRPGLVDSDACAEVMRRVTGGESIETVEHTLQRSMPSDPSGVRGRGCVRAAVLHLLWCGRLVTDLSRPLGIGAELWPAGSAIVGVR